jgi:hypothetical protein
VSHAKDLREVIAPKRTFAWRQNPVACWISLKKDMLRLLSPCSHERVLALCGTIRQSAPRICCTLVVPYLTASATFLTSIVRRYIRPITRSTYQETSTRRHPTIPSRSASPHSLSSIHPLPDVHMSIQVSYQEESKRSIFDLGIEMYYLASDIQRKQEGREQPASLQATRNGVELVFPGNEAAHEVETKDSASQFGLGDNLREETLWRQQYLSGVTA